MSWEYYLLPLEPGSLFSGELLAQARAYWREEPVYERTDGVIILCSSHRRRDQIVAEGSIDDVRDWETQVIALRPGKITLGVEGDDAMNIKFRAFIEWVMERAEARLTDEWGTEVTPDEFLRRQLSVNRNRN